ncbi:MAG TPA: hypothetical protein VLH84_02650 [Patescibacteria group bacterium]|nr:hypothetical protein [Patescibacteria group bacterium]
MPNEALLSERDRDLSRAHMQRTVGVVVSRETVEPFYAERRAYIPSLTADEIFMTDSPYPLPATSWAAAQRVSEILLNCPVTMPEVGIETIDDIMSQLTYAGTTIYSMREGMETQAHFPLHLAYDISVAAQREWVPGFETDTLHSIINLLNRTDFRAMVDTAAFTANARWRSYSTSFHKTYKLFEGGPPLRFTFDEAGNVDFTPALKIHLLKALDAVNKAGKSEGGYDTPGSTSSGCPARRLRPSFTGTTHDEANIGALAAYFNISPDAVEATRDTNIIFQGLDLLVEALEHVEPLVEAHITQERAARRQSSVGTAVDDASLGCQYT